MYEPLAPDFDRTVLDSLGGTQALLQAAERAARSAGEGLVEAFAHRDELVVETKSRNDFVSRADRESEECIVRVLHDAFDGEPGRILGEEGGVRGSGSEELEWICDPLDGTTNFLEGLPIWCISIAARYQGRLVVGVVHDPMRDTLYCGSVGGGATMIEGGRSGKSTPLAVSQRQPEDGFLSTGFPFRAVPVVDEFLALFRSALVGSRAIRRCGAAALDLAHTAAGIYDGFFEFRLSPWDVAAGGLLICEAGGVVSDLDGGNEWISSGNILAGGALVHEQLRRWAGQVTSQTRIEALVSPAP